MKPTSSLARLIRWVMRDTTYHGCYAATVEVDNGDGTFDVRIENPDLPIDGVQQAKARAGLPGTTIGAEQGAPCLVGFEEGDPAKPYIAAWSGEGLRRVEITGARPIARVGDTLDVMLPPVVTVAGIVEGEVVTSPGPPPVVSILPPTPFEGVVTVTSKPLAVIQTGLPDITA